MSHFTGSSSYQSTSIPPTATGSRSYGSDEKSSSPTIMIDTTMKPGSRFAWFTQPPMINTTDSQITVSCQTESLDTEDVRAGYSALKRKKRFIDVSHKAPNPETFNMFRRTALSRARKAIDKETSRFERSSVGEERAWYRRDWSVNGTNPRTVQLIPVQANSLLLSIRSMIFRDQTGRSGWSNTSYESFELTAEKDATTARSFVDVWDKTGTEPHMTKTKRWLGI